MEKQPDFVYVVCQERTGGIIVVIDEESPNGYRLPGGRVNSYNAERTCDAINKRFHEQVGTRLGQFFTVYSKPVHISQRPNGDNIWYYAAEDVVSAKDGSIDIKTISLADIVELNADYRWLSNFDEQILIGKSMNQCFYQAVNEAYFGRASKQDIEVYLEKGADPNYIGNFSGDLPLALAARKGDIKLMEVLLKHGANVNQVSEFGAAATSALMEILISDQCSMEGLDMLLQYGADIQQLDYYKNTVLHTLVSSNRGKTINIEYIEKLIALGIDVNQQNVGGSTPLLLATLGDEDNIIDVLRILLKNGADSQIQTNDGKTLFELGHVINKEEIIKNNQDFIRIFDENKRLMESINEINSSETLTF